MDLRKLKTLIDLVSESNISELEITEAEGKVRIVKAAEPVVMMQAMPQQHAMMTAAPMLTPVPTTVAVPELPAAPVGHVVKSDRKSVV